MNRPLDVTTFASPAVEAAFADDRYEVVDGVVVEMPTVSNVSMAVADTFLEFARPFARQNRLGRAVREIIFRLAADAERSYRPDSAFVGVAKWPLDRPIPRDDPWELAPDLAMEVISPSNTAEDTLDRVFAYLGAGCRLVWIVYPNHRQVYEYESPTAVRILHGDAELDGGSVLPGFRLPLATLFADVPRPAR